jgi:penicillin-binding protein 1C
VSGTVIALNPDIPPARQRLIFEADAGNLSLHWVLDGLDLGSAARPLLWEPSPGQHTMGLMDQDRRVLDSVTLIVRDGALPPSE